MYSAEKYDVLRNCYAVQQKLFFGDWVTSWVDVDDIIQSEIHWQ